MEPRLKAGLFIAALGALGNLPTFGAGGRGGRVMFMVKPREPKYKARRNEPCPCGSGKKFKACCIGEPAESKGELHV